MPVCKNFSITLKGVFSYRIGLTEFECDAVPRGYYVGMEGYPWVLPAPGETPPTLEQQIPGPVRGVQRKPNGGYHIPTCGSTATYYLMSPDGKKTYLLKTMQEFQQTYIHPTLPTSFLGRGRATCTENGITYVGTPEGRRIQEVANWEKMEKVQKRKITLSVGKYRFQYTMDKNFLSYSPLPPECLLRDEKSGFKITPDQSMMNIFLENPHIFFRHT